ncbi:Protein GRINL1B [Heterocephalus glaber]|uniref:Protein GRINL1B n=1 Tax=Heterocephalus glaber TaxID=10181 RepID=G5B9V2_HETGA|nr:Protein GRINL1B [Heterocephalus glaber]
MVQGLWTVALRPRNANPCSGLVQAGPSFFDPKLCLKGSTSIRAEPFLPFYTLPSALRGTYRGGPWRDERRCPSRQGRYSAPRASARSSQPGEPYGPRLLHAGKCAPASTTAGVQSAGVHPARAATVPPGPVREAASLIRRPPLGPPQPPQQVLAAAQPRAPSSRGLGAAEFGGAAGDAEAPERLLRKGKFICKLFEKAKEISDTVAKLKAAITEREEDRRKSELFYLVSVDFELRQKAIAGVDVNIDKTPSSDQMLDTSSLVPGCSLVDKIKSSKTISEKQGLVPPTHKDNEETPEAESTVNQHPAPNGRAGTLSPTEEAEHLPQRCFRSHRRYFQRLGQPVY